MSALTDLFTSMANKIRSKVGGSQTYTPLQMVSAIDDVYDAGAASVPSPSSITPSNASPVSLTADNAVKPTTSGYAIASYSSVTPSDASPVTLTSGGIIKLGGNGKAVENVNSITPSTNVPSMTANKIYKPSGNGYAIAAYTNLYPSNSNPPAISGPYMYRLPSGYSGYVYANKFTLYSLLSSSNFGNAGTGSQTQSFDATAGKHYLICATRSSTGTPQNVAISSGATVDTTLVDNVMNSTSASARVKLWVAIVTATATTITMAGTFNVCVYLLLD